jgi:hypothetical protein
MKQVDYVRMAEKCAREADRMPSSARTKPAADIATAKIDIAIDVHSE